MIVNFIGVVYDGETLIRSNAILNETNSETEQNCV